MSAQPLFDLLVTARLLVFLLGFLIAFQAFRGYRRNDSPPMLYLAVGFALISARPLVNIPLARLFSPQEFGTVTIALDVVFLGTAFLAILYSLRRIESADPSNSSGADRAGGASPSAARRDDRE